MDPPPLNQGTSATVQVVPTFDTHDGRYVGVVLVKEKFFVSLEGTALRAGDAEIRMADELWDPDNPDVSTLKYAADTCLRKPSTDVVVVGAAMAPGGQEVTELDVLLRAGGVQKALKVFGARAWYRGGVGTMVPTPPQPFAQAPIRWELAFGGSDYETDPAKPLEEPRNPRGCGLVRDPDLLEGTAVPSVEDPNDLITSHRSRPAPAGFAPIGRNYAPRRDYVGTYDELWMTERMPLNPLDYDDRFSQTVAPDQVAAAPMRGGEQIDVLGMNADGPISFALPKMRFFVGRQDANGAMTEHPPQLDTVLLEPNERKLEMTWRSIVPLPRQMRDLRFIQVHEKRII